MSPVSRGRKNAKPRRSNRPDLRLVEAVPEPCDCPVCAAGAPDLEAVVAGVTAEAAELFAVEDPFEAELFGATLLGTAGPAGDAFTEELVPALAAAKCLTALLAIEAVGGSAATAGAAASLMDAGAPAPAWLSALSEPVTAGICRRYDDPTGETSMLQCTFDRSGNAHGFFIQVDHTECDAAADLILFPGEMLAEVSDMLLANGRDAGVTLTVEELDPAEFRWQAERALDARAVHDDEDEQLGIDDVSDEEDGPGYHTLAALLRARLRVLPEPARPPAPHGDNDRPARPAIAVAPFAAQLGKLPAKRKKSDGPAPIYQIKVGLRGAKPPIWRRLELPGDISLASLHRAVQIAFGWDDSHLHVFETPYGDFGVADRELGYRAEKPVTLEQVAPAAGDKLRYRYDFGDDWEHEIVVEKLLDRQAVAYPRCTAGRRAAPPDDCGGIWGYADLVETLADPSHPEHRDRLEWLGLTSAADFQPARFDPAEVTRALNEQR